MNCKEFESIVLGLDRDAAAGTLALEHASACEGCRAELNAIKELRASLAALAMQDASLEAPPGVEAGLMRKLGESHEPARRGFAPARPVAAPRLRLFLAAAAAILAFAIVASIIYTRAVTKNPPMRGSNPSNAHSPDPGSGGRDQPKSPDQRVTPDRNEQTIRPDRLGTAGGGQLAIVRESGSSKPSRRVQRGIADRGTAGDYEIATDFFPISYGSYLQPADGGQIVRIKLPRSALGSYGLPVDPLRADEAIKADVVIGNDGMARAIRFVH